MYYKIIIYLGGKVEFYQLQLKNLVKLPVMGTHFEDDKIRVNQGSKADIDQEMIRNPKRNNSYL